jgi:hypothetical protein
LGTKSASTLRLRIRRRFKPIFHLLEHNILCLSSTKSPCAFDALEQIQGSGFGQRAGKQRRREYAGGVRHLEQFFSVCVFDAINSSRSAAEHSNRQSRHVKEEIHRRRLQIISAITPD